MLAEFDWGFNHDVAVQIAGIAGPDTFDALAAQAELLAGLGALGYVDGGFARQRGNLDFTAHRGGRKTDWHRAVDVIAFALEDIVFLSRISMYRSPVGPPLVPGSPLFALRMRMPPSMPAGILISSVFCRLILPWPEQAVQGSGTTLPVPRQVGQVCCTLKKPWRI